MKRVYQSKLTYLNGKQTTLILDCSGRSPYLVYWGNKFDNPVSDEMILKLGKRQEAPCSPSQEVSITLSPTHGSGFCGHPGIEIFNEKKAWSYDGKIDRVENIDNQKIVIESWDEIRRIRIIHELKISKEDVIECTTELINEDETTLMVNSCFAPTLCVPHHMNQLIGFEGQWGKEFQLNKQEIHLGTYCRENRRGKTSHDSYPSFLVSEKDTNEERGECYGFHLGWSGNHQLRFEKLSDGRSYAQLGELLFPGEVRLKKGESYKSPSLFASFSSKGFSDLSHNFHSFVRNQIISDKIKSKPRPVHYNTWEAIYFDHDLETLKELTVKASNLGVERFVLDDGWFQGRVNDRAGLGDWFVDEKRYPNGLSPLIETVLEKGMEFGIWLEPEMVNPDSDLYRNHPNWVLRSEGNEQLNFRHQYVLDLTNPEVTDYLYNCIDSLLKEYPQISYIKWDINRDINHPENEIGRPVVHQYIHCLYSLINKIKKAHPELEIESCSSGGGRADYGILRFTDRVWTSDSNDALDRLGIQKGFSFFLPSEVMGSHVGPRTCHITGRHIDIEMRSSVSLFGHMGIEMDPRELNQKEEEALSKVISFYKEYRSLIHKGNLERLDVKENISAFMIVSSDKSNALFSYNLLEKGKTSLPEVIRLRGLNPAFTYRLNLLLPTELKEYSPSILEHIEGGLFTGEILIKKGIQMPLRFPSQNLTFILKTCN